jgi:hypothetical protein
LDHGLHATPTIATPQTIMLAGSPIISQRVTLKSLATAARLASSSLSRWVLSVTLSLPIIRFATSFEIECAAFVTSLCIPASFNWFR